MKVSVDHMRRHFLELCQAQGPDFSVYWCKRLSQAYAVREAEEITIAPILSAVSYATALHELGHLKGRYQNSPLVIVRERWAWRWARSASLIWTPAMERCATDSLASYAAKIDARSRGNRPARSRRRKPGRASAVVEWIVGRLQAP